MNDENTTPPAVLDLPSHDITAFHPAKTQVKLAELDGEIVKWRALKDWPKVEEAVDLKIAEQVAFCDNWKKTVTGNRHNINPDPENPARGFLSVGQAQDLWGFSQQAVSRWGKALAKCDAYRAKLITGARVLAGLDAADNHRAEGTGENEWYTPPQYIAAARAVMGGIDLDPASSLMAQTSVVADKFYTKEDDGLTKDWHGRVWLNPPYTQPDIEQFVFKLVEEGMSGRVSEAILLTHNYTDTKWFQHAAAHAALICFTRGRVKFTNADGDDCAPTQGQAFFYFGANEPDFANTFAQYGFIVQRYG